ncbi:hypothetical protein J3R82DRAFT_11237 [Butyriboletus roseoflavus]|nr:hypothetical protein J3R82DRAFT_11237 [Butyriboletus roseoflavus]
MPEFSSSQILEFFIVLCTAHHYRYDITSFRSASAHAESKSGPVQSASMPTRLYRFITPLQAFTYFLFPTIYIFAVVNDRFQQPSWMDAFALPEMVGGVKVDGIRKNAVRVLACVATIALQRLSDDVFEHLGDQFHPIGSESILPGNNVSVARNRGSSKVVRTPGFVILSTCMPIIPFSLADNTQTDGTT